MSELVDLLKKTRGGYIRLRVRKENVQRLLEQDSRLSEWSKEADQLVDADRSDDPAKRMRELEAQNNELRRLLEEQRAREKQKGPASPANEKPKAGAASASAPNQKPAAEKPIKAPEQPKKG